MSAGDPAKAAELGIVPLGQRRSVRRCIARGIVLVNAPVIVLLIAGYGLLLPFFPLIPFDYFDTGGLPGTLAGVFTVASIIVAGTVPAWLWWSYRTPKWRIWALRHVDDWRGLESAAIVAGIIWPRGWIFNRTEIKSAADRKLEQDLIAYRDKAG